MNMGGHLLLVSFFDFRCMALFRDWYISFLFFVCWLHSGMIHPQIAMSSFLLLKASSNKFRSGFLSLPCMFLS